MQNWMKGRKETELFPCKLLNQQSPSTIHKGATMNKLFWLWIWKKKKKEESCGSFFSFPVASLVSDVSPLLFYWFFCHHGSIPTFSPALFLPPPPLLATTRKRNKHVTSGKVVLDGCLSQPHQLQAYRDKNVFYISSLHLLFPCTLFQLNKKYMKKIRNHLSPLWLFCFEQSRINSFPLTFKKYIDHCCCTVFSGWSVVQYLTNVMEI